MKSKFECGCLCPVWVVFWRYCCSTSDWVGRHLHLMPYDMSSSMSAGYISQKVSCVFSLAPSLIWTHSILINLIIPHRIHGTNGILWYLPTWMLDFYGKSVGKYTVHSWIRHGIQTATLAHGSDSRFTVPPLKCARRVWAVPAPFFFFGGKRHEINGKIPGSMIFKTGCYCDVCCFSCIFWCYPKLVCWTSFYVLNAVFWGRSSGLRCFKLHHGLNLSSGSLRVSTTFETALKPDKNFTTVDGWNPANQLRLVVYPIIYGVLYIPGGAGFLPSTVCDSTFVGDPLPLAPIMDQIWFYPSLWHQSWTFFDSVWSCGLHLRCNCLVLDCNGQIELEWTVTPPGRLTLKPSKLELLDDSNLSFGQWTVRIHAAFVFRENWDDLLTKVKAMELRLEAAPPWAFGQTAGRCFFTFRLQPSLKGFQLQLPKPEPQKQWRLCALKSQRTDNIW